MRTTRQDELHFRNIPQWDGRRRRRSIGGGHEEKPLAQHFLGDQMFCPWRLIKHGNVGSTGCKPFPHISGKSLNDLKCHVGVFFSQSLDQRNDEDLADGRRNAEDYLAGRYPRQFAHFPFGAIQVLQDCLGSFEEDVAGLSRCNAPSIAMEKSPP